MSSLGVKSGGRGCPSPRAGRSPLRGAGGRDVCGRPPGGASVAAVSRAGPAAAAAVRCAARRRGRRGGCRRGRVGGRSCSRPCASREAQMRCKSDVVPEGHELAQVGGTDMQPGQAVGAGGRLVPVESMQLLYQHRLLEPQGLGEFGREHELRIGDGDWLAWTNRPDRGGRTAYPASGISCSIAAFAEALVARAKDNRVRVQRVRLRLPQVAGAVQRLRRLEHAQRGAPRHRQVGRRASRGARRAMPVPWPRRGASRTSIPPRSTRIGTGMAEFDRVLGGGLVPGSAFSWAATRAPARARCCCRPCATSRRVCRPVHHR
jgi:hypothetical protein